MVKGSVCASMKSQPDCQFLSNWHFAEKYKILLPEHSVMKAIKMDFLVSFQPLKEVQTHCG